MRSQEIITEKAQKSIAPSLIMPRSFWEMIHRILIIFDDYLCKEFSFSRKARGKYVDKTRVTVV